MVDNALSPALAVLLTDAGHDAGIAVGHRSRILSNLSQFSEALESGSIVTLEPSRLRVRTLPIGGTTNEPR